ncbi:tryptophan synthase subunit beta [Candidatus Woesearchaeota archaeon]|nr:tryptophan synthase subunit beta [Candidatus Woesearchaeota archaeon]
MRLNTKFGKYGGTYVSELLMPALEELEAAYIRSKKDRKFQRELKMLLKEYAGRPTRLYFAKNLSEKLGCRIYLKREDLLHGGAHKTNNGIGQGLLAKYMGKTRIIAETGAGQHGFAAAMAGAFFDIKTEIYMGTKDIERQKMNVNRMKLCGAKINPVSLGSCTLKDAISECLRDWVANVKHTYYLLGTVAGPHPYPSIVRDFQKVIGEEVKEQILKKEKRLPDYILACVGGGSNAMGIFNAFLKEKKVKLIGVEPAGRGLNTKFHGAAICKGSPGIFDGALSYLLQDKHGQINESYSISAGLDYPGVGSQLSFLHDSKRVRFTAATDKETLAAFRLLAETEGIIPALESAHAVAYAIKISKGLTKENLIVINLSGRGDKDVFHAMKALGGKSDEN